MEKYTLYLWQYSSISDDTAYFYFKIKGKRKGLMVEYWVDEDVVAECTQYCDLESGNLYEDDFYYLNEDEKNMLSKFCKETIKKDNND